MVSPLKLMFWGTRGHVSSPRHNTAIFGGNTPCIQILSEDQLIIVDTGFGVSNLGEVLMERIIGQGEKLTIHIFYSHFHWDHIQGLPFFHPIYFPTTSLKLYSPFKSQEAKENLNLLFDGSYSPFEGIDSMPSAIEIVELDKKPAQIAGLSVDFVRVDHGSDSDQSGSHGAYAYRFTGGDGSSVVIASDHEARESDLNKQLIQFAKGCDLLIHDGHFMDNEYSSRIGWGHSTMSQALENGIQSGCGKLVLTHHAPFREDREIEDAYHQYLKDPKYRGLDFEFAREGVEYVAKPSQRPK